MESLTNACTILVVEDIAEISLQIHQLLDRRGYRVLHASNAEEAIQIAEKDRPVVILTDFELPTFGQLMKLVREHDRLRNLVVAIIDMNSPDVTDNSVEVLPDFAALDALITSTHKQQQF